MLPDIFPTGYHRTEPAMVAPGKTVAAVSRHTQSRTNSSCVELAEIRAVGGG
jgi:hypothetical protein